MPRKKTSGTTRKLVSNEDFVKAFITADSTAEVAEKTGLTIGSVRLRASKLRKAGVNLPTFVRKPRPIDVDALNELIKKLK